MASKLDGPRILIYSHDSFGLGHLRRCRAIAHALAGARQDLSVLILSGLPLIGSFDFPARVDFVRIPGVIKLSNGDYTPRSLPLGIDRTMMLRGSIIRHTAEVFDPHIMIVDKEPLGLRGEVGETLGMLKERGRFLVLGLRDVLDEPALLAPEFEHKKVLPALRDLYDEIWVYGLPQIYDPLADIGLPEAVMRKMIYTGYLRRSLPDAAPPRADEPGILVTAGGGGDGEVLMEWVLSAYETDPGIPHPALLVFGPFMPGEAREAFQARAEALDKVTAIDFDAQIEQLIDRSIGVVAMGGYNTFCEILSFDKPSLIVPRTQPRKEQLIRARRAQELGLARLLGDDGTRDPKRMAVALRQLPQQERPSKVILPGLLDGLPNINRLVERELEDRSGRELSLVERKG